MTTKKCSKPTVAMVKLGDSDWTPACADHLEAARKKSAKAGKAPAPKNKEAAAAHAVANRDDRLPVHARALTETEKEMAPACLASTLGG